MVISFLIWTFVQHGARSCHWHLPLTLAGIRHRENPGARQSPITFVAPAPTVSRARSELGIPQLTRSLERELQSASLDGCRV